MARHAGTKLVDHTLKCAQGKGEKFETAGDGKVMEVGRRMEFGPHPAA